MGKYGSKAGLDKSLGAAGPPQVARKGSRQGRRESAADLNKLTCPGPCHFDRREKSLIPNQEDSSRHEQQDFSHTFEMTMAGYKWLPGTGSTNLTGPDLGRTSGPQGFAPGTARVSRRPEQARLSRSVSFRPEGEIFNS
jgi:hypothetical protein